MDKLRISGSAATAPTYLTEQQQGEQYPRSLTELYLRASIKIKKIERMVFKRFAPSVADVQLEFQRLAYSFEESNIMQYAAMCHIGYAKCESYGGSAQREAEAYLRAARDFLQAHNDFGRLHLRTAHNGFKEGALHCYNKAAERVADGCVIKAAVLRELKRLQRQLDSTSSFASATHRLNDLEYAADVSLQHRDYLTALQHFDDIVDNIYERRQPPMYADLLRRLEVLRLLLLVHLSLPPARQSPAHIKLIDYYYALAQFEHDKYDEQMQLLKTNTHNVLNSQQQMLLIEPLPCLRYNNEPVERPGAFVPAQQQYALAEIVCAWVERNMCDLKALLKNFTAHATSISTAERHLLKTMQEDLSMMF